METPKLLTDDMDIRDTVLTMYHGNNGDYYICLKETKRGEVVKLDTRIAMSGGNATPEVQKAVANLFKALTGQKADTGEGQSNIPDVSGSADVDKGHGTCLECRKRYATIDYNGHDCWVCQPCYESLEREFEDEYR